MGIADRRIGTNNHRRYRKIGRKILWDYSGIPGGKFEWEYEPGNYMNVRPTPIGLSYHGDLLCGPYAGPYGAGFQSYEDFFTRGPLYNMPEEQTGKLRNLLQSKRNPGGAYLHVIFNNSSQGLISSAVSAGIDEITIHARAEPPDNSVNDEIFFTGSCSPGVHMLSLCLVFLDRDNGRQHTAYCKIDFKLKKNNDSVLMIRAMYSDSSQINVNAILGKLPLKIYDIKLYVLDKEHNC